MSDTSLDSCGSQNFCFLKYSGMTLKPLKTLLNLRVKLKLNKISHPLIDDFTRYLTRAGFGIWQRQNCISQGRNEGVSLLTD